MRQASDVRDADEHLHVGGVAAEPHWVQFYEDERALLDRVVRFASDGLAEGDFVVVIATEPHSLALRTRMRAESLDVTAALESGRLLFLDAHAMLAKFMVDGEPDPSRFEV